MDKELKIKIKNAIFSKTFKRLIYIFGVLAVACLIFEVGVFVGGNRASFGRDWGDNYEKNFGSPHRNIRMMGGNIGDFGNLPNPNGAIGKIIKVELPTIIVLDPKDNTEKVILVNDQTEIRNMREKVSMNALALDRNIIVIGSPNSSGQIEAKLIRFLPAPLPLPTREINQ